MDVLKIKQEMEELLHRADPAITIPSMDTDLFAQECRVAPRDLLFVCMELKKKYPIDYNKVVEEVKTYSLEQLASAICAQLA